MNNIKYFVFVGIAFVFIGCPARALSPLFAPKDILFNPGLIGAWGDEEKKEMFIFEQSEDKNYTLTVREDDGDTTIYTVQLGKIGKYWFLDSYPGWSKRDYHDLGTHMISRIWIEGDTLRTSSLEGDRLKELIESGALKIPHSIVDGQVILTATTQELQKLVLRLAEDKKAFPKPDGSLVRVL